MEQHSEVGNDKIYAHDRQKSPHRLNAEVLPQGKSKNTKGRKRCQSSQ